MEEAWRRLRYRSMTGQRNLGDKKCEILRCAQNDMFGLRMTLGLLSEIENATLVEIAIVTEGGTVFSFE